MPVEGHDIFYHLRVLIGLIVGLALARMLAGIAKFVTHPGQKPLYAAHLLWALVVIIMSIHFWWFEFGLVLVRTWTFDLYVFVLFYAFLLYLLATLLIPDDIAEYESYGDYFISRRRWFFGLFAVTVPVDLVDTLVKGRAYYDSYGPEYPFRLVGMLVVCAVGAWVKDRRVQVALAALYLVDLVFWILRSYRILE